MFSTRRNEISLIDSIFEDDFFPSWKKEVFSIEERMKKMRKEMFRGFWDDEVFSDEEIEEKKDEEVVKPEKNDEEVKPEKSENQKEIETKETVEIPEKPREEERVPELEKAEIPKFYSYSSRTISESINGNTRMKRIVKDSEKGRKDIELRKIGDRILRVKKKTDLDGKEKIETNFRNLKGEEEVAQFENDWEVLDFPKKQKFLGIAF